MSGAVVYAAEVSCLNDPALYARAYALVGAQRQQKADGLRFRKDRNLSLGAGVLLRYALWQAGFSDVPELRYGENEKPYLLYSEFFFFSLSHSGTVAVCACSDRELGCDVERLGAPRPSLARRFFHPDEAAALEKSEDARDFYRLWTCKEAFMKAVGLGLRLSMDSFCVTLADPPRLSRSVCEKQYRLQEFIDLPGYACSLCMEEPCGDAIFQKVDLTTVLNG